MASRIHSLTVTQIMQNTEREGSDYVTASTLGDLLPLLRAVFLSQAALLPVALVLPAGFPEQRAVAWQVIGPGSPRGRWGETGEEP